ncbi:MAG: TIM barrel protein [Acetobacteraceae bacterium]|nr:TIM barrel protein [Acetobacteraceae bacterium]
MPRFAANLTMMFNEVPFLERFAAARRAGFEAVEFLSPYEHPAEAVAGAAKAAGVGVVLHNVALGDFAGGERGLGALASRKADFDRAMEQGFAYATALGCPRLHVMCGRNREGAARETFVANLKAHAPRAAAAGIKLVIEPINSMDMPDYFLTDIDEAAAIIEEVGPEKVGLQFDIYHRQVQRGDIARAFERVLAYISHVQIADNPGRNEPGTGEIGWAHLFALMDRLGYRGWVGCEYKPAGNTEAGLAWRRKFAV